MASYRKYGHMPGPVKPTNTLSRTGPSGALAGSVSVGAQEYRTVEENSRKHRERHRSGSHLRHNNHMETIDPISDSLTDELAGDEYRVEIRRTRPATQLGTYINPPLRSSRFTDGADSQILARLNQSTKGQKRKGPPSDIEDDELGEYQQPRHRPKTAKRVPANSKHMVESPSVSQRGAIAPTIWISSPPKSKAFRVRVKEAVCQQHYLLSNYHTSTTDSGQCYLQPVEGRNELRAFRDDGSLARGVSDWLKIGSKTKCLLYNDDSEIIRITQSSEDNLNIGSLMLLQFANARDAANVVSWVKENLTADHIKVSIEGNRYEHQYRPLNKKFILISHREKLAQIFNKTKEEIKKAYHTVRKSARNESLRIPERLSESQSPGSDVLGPVSTSPPEAPSRDRVLHRDRMQVSNPQIEDPAPQHSSHQQPSEPPASRDKPTAKSSDDTQFSTVDSSGLTSPHFSNHNPRPRALRSRQSVLNRYSLEDEPDPEPEPEPEPEPDPEPDPDPET